MQLAQTYKLLTNSNFLSLQWQQRPNYDSDELRRKPSSLVYPIMYGCDDSFGCPLAQCWDCVQCTLTILKTTQMIVHCLFTHTVPIKPPGLYTKQGRQAKQFSSAGKPGISASGVGPAAKQVQHSAAGSLTFLSASNLLRL